LGSGSQDSVGAVPPIQISCDVLAVQIVPTLQVELTLDDAHYSRRKKA